jgi:hypothetical protein
MLRIYKKKHRSVLLNVFLLLTENFQQIKIVTNDYTATCMSVTIDGVSIGNGFIDHSQMVTTCNYSSITNSHALQFTTARTKPSHSSVFISRCLVTASNGGRSPYSGFPNSPRVSATSFSQQQLTRTELQLSSNWLTHSPNNSLHFTDSVH